MQSPSPATTGRSTAPAGAPQIPAAHRVDTAVVTVAALLLFAVFLTEFVPQVTDLGARRVLRGDVIYRDFWTMYAPGSIYVTAAAYALFGEHVIVGNVLGVLVSAAGVAACHRLCLRVAGRGPAFIAAGIFAVALFSAGYQNALSSYPPAMLFLWLAMARLADHAAGGRHRDLILTGVLLGVAALFKHDVAAYFCLAAAVALLVTGGRAAVGQVLAVAASVVAVMLAAVLALIAAGAGPNLVADLVTYPLTDFRHVRSDRIPLLPAIWSGGLERRVWEAQWWAFLTVPAIVLLAALPVLWRHRAGLSAPARRIAVFALVAYPLFWSAAHVQANTHRITMASLAAVVAATAWTLATARTAGVSPTLRRLALTTIAAWCAILMVVPAQRFRPRAGGVEAVGLPRFAGIRMPPEEAQRLRGLAAAIRDAAPPDAPFLMLGWRNDVMVHAASTPYWLTDRRFLTGHHELHPGITDTEPVQIRMLAAITGGMTPVIVREHRFPGSVLDRVGRTYRERGVPVGATLLDDWVRDNCRGGERFGMYEIMACRGNEVLPADGASTARP